MHSPSSTLADNPVDELLVTDAIHWREWLQDHHAAAASVWVVLAKKGAPAPTSLTFDDALAEAVCFGWIDNKTRRRDASTYLIRFTPRRPGGTWSASNVQLAERLMAGGLMHPAGLAAVERAQAEGRWKPRASPRR